jgi:HAD superfamily hydrolase (TIGR01509 family)
MKKRSSDESNLFLRQHWIFDLDGTLTLPVHDFGAIRSELGIPAESDILGWLEALPPEKRRPLLRRLDEIETELAETVEPAPGAISLLHSLHARGYRLGILTRNLQSIAQRCLTALGVADFFHPDCIIGRQEARPKPDPDGIFHLLARWNARSSDSLIVGDYRYDLLAGRAAGIATIHVDSKGDYAWPESSDLCVNSLQAIELGLQEMNPD